jgi:hypothetical protein
MRTAPRNRKPVENQTVASVKQNVDENLSRQKEITHPLALIHIKLVKSDMSRSYENVLDMMIHPLKNCKVKLPGAFLVNQSSILGHSFPPGFCLLLFLANPLIPTSPPA